MDQNIIIKGTPQKNKPALIVIIVGAVLLLTSFMVASYVFNNCDGYQSFGFGYGGWYYWCVIYDFAFGEFFFGEFFNFSCYYGYMIMLGIVALIVGIVMKVNTEKCEITVTNEAISGKLPHGKDVNIPLNQITAINRSSFNGVSVTSIGKQLRQAASLYELVYSAKGYNEVDVALEKADLKETFPSDFSRERICIYDNQGNQFLSVFYHTQKCVCALSVEHG